MPDEFVIQLPCRSVEELFKSYKQAVGGKKVELSWFRKVMKMEFKHVKCSRYKRFTQCTVCKDLTEGARKDSDSSRAEAARKKQIHKVTILQSLRFCFVCFGLKRVSLCV